MMWEPHEAAIMRGSYDATHDSAGNLVEERETPARGMENHHRTDRQIFLDLLERNEIPFTDEGLGIVLTVDRWAEPVKVDGYSDFLTRFVFEPGGKLDHVEVWE